MECGQYNERDQYSGLAITSLKIPHYRWGLDYTPLQRGKSHPSKKECPVYDIKLNLMARLQFRSSGEFRVSWNYNYLLSKVSKVGDFSRGWPEGSLFDRYYTEV